MKNVEESLDNFITTAAKRNKVDGVAFLPWKQKLLELLTAKCEVAFARPDAPFHNFFVQ